MNVFLFCGWDYNGFFLYCQGVGLNWGLNFGILFFGGLKALYFTGSLTVNTIALDTKTYEYLYIIRRTKVDITLELEISTF